MKRAVVFILSLILAATVIGLFTACKKQDEPSGQTPGENVNVYGGEGDFVFAKWQAELTDVYDEVTVGQDGSTSVHYNKTAVLDKYTGLYSEISGATADFNYLNITVKGKTGQTLLMRMGDSTLTAVVLGQDKVLAISEEETTYSYKISAPWMLSSVKEVYLIIDPGQGGPSNAGTFTVSKTWLSASQPEGSLLAQDSPWKNGGAYRFTQVGNVTRVAYEGVPQNSWQNMFIDFEAHDWTKENVMTFTLKNTGESSIYFSIKTLAANDPNDSGSLTWNDVDLPAGEEQTVSLQFTQNIRKLVMFVDSGLTPTSGRHSGSFEISEIVFSYIDPSLICSWTVMNKFTIEEKESEVDISYTDLVNADWSQFVAATVYHDFEKYNHVRVTLKNTGNESVEYFVKAQLFDATEVKSTLVTLGAGEETTVSLQLDRKIDQVLVWLNVYGDPQQTTSGSYTLSNPSFYYEEPMVFSIADGENGSKNVTFSNLPFNSWTQNVYIALTHDAAAANAMRFTLTNTGNTTLYLWAKTELAEGGDGNSQVVTLAAYESKEISIDTDKQINALAIFVSVSGTGAPEDGSKFSGSFTVSAPEFFSKEVSPWTATSAFKLIAKNGITTVSYTDLAKNSWNQNIFLAKPEYAQENTLKLAFAKVSGERMCITIKLECGNGEQYGKVTLDENNPTGECVLTLTSGKINNIVLFVNVEDATQDISTGSFTVSTPAFELKQPAWQGTPGFTLSDGEGITTVSYTDLAANAWNENIILQQPVYTSENTLKLSFAKVSGSWMCITVKLECESGEQYGKVMLDENNQTGECVLFLTSGKIKNIILFANVEDAQEATYTGSFTVSDPVFEIRQPAWQATFAFELTQQEGSVTISYTDLAKESWGENIFLAQPVYTEEGTLSLSFENTGKTWVCITVKLECENGEQYGKVTMDSETLTGDCTISLTAGKVNKIVFFVNVEDATESTYSGSFTVTDLTFE